MRHANAKVKHCTHFSLAALSASSSSNVNAFRSGYRGNRKSIIDLVVDLNRKAISTRYVHL